MPRIVNGPLLTARVVSRQTGVPLAGVTVTVSKTVYSDPELASGATTTLTTNGAGVFSAFAAAGTYTFTVNDTSAAPVEPIEILSGQGSTSGAYAPVLVPTATKTANYTASPGDLVPVDTTSGSVTVTLPTAPVDGARIAVKQIVRGGTNTVTVAVGGSDHIATNNATTRTVTLLGEAVELQYQASTALWFIAASDTPVGQLDLRYGQLAAANEWQTMQTLDGGLTMGTPNGVSANVWFTSASQGWQGGPKWELGIDSSNNGGGLDFYFAKAAWRVILDGVLNSTTTLTSATAQFGTSDVGKAISGTGIPGGTTIASVTNATTVVLSAAATATATGVTVTVGTVNAVGDTIYVSNGAGNSPTVGIGVTPPSTTVPAAARLQVAGATADPTLDILKLLQASSSTGKYLKCTDSGGTDRLWVESDGTLRGAQNGIGGSLVIALPTGAATKALQVTNSGKTAVYGWDFASNTSTNSKIRYETGGFDLISFTSVGDVVVGNAALATGATGGFFWLPTVAGTPTGTPSSTFTGRTPMIVDTTGSKIWALISGTWKSVTLA